MVSFRLTDEEYVRFRRLCISYGARNVSELVRTAVNHMMDQLSADELTPDHAGPEMHLRVEHLESRLAELISTVGQLEGRLAAGPAASSGATLLPEGVSGQ
jgi:hypothetical protein